MSTIKWPTVSVISTGSAGVTSVGSGISLLSSSTGIKSLTFGDGVSGSSSDTEASLFLSTITGTLLVSGSNHFFRISPTESPIFSSSINEKMLIAVNENIEINSDQEITLNSIQGLNFFSDSDIFLNSDTIISGTSPIIELSASNDIRLTGSADLNATLTTASFFLSGDFRAAPNNDVLFLAGNDFNLISTSGSFSFQALNGSVEIESSGSIDLKANNEINQITLSDDQEGVSISSDNSSINLSASNGVDVTGSIDQHFQTDSNYYNLNVSFGLYASGGSRLFNGETLFLPSFVNSQSCKTGGIVYYNNSAPPFLMQSGSAASGSPAGVDKVIFLCIGENYGSGFLSRGVFNYQFLSQAQRNDLLSGSSNTGSLDEGQIFMDPNNPGGLTSVAPTGSGEFARVIGHKIGSDNVVYFNPSPDYIKIA